MKSKFINEIRKSFESSSEVTPQWAKFFSLARRHFKKILNDDAENIVIDRGHFYFSGFFTRKLDGLIFYISCSDVRGGVGGLLIRSASSDNYNIRFEGDFEEKLLKLIRSFPDRRCNAEKFITNI